MPGCALITGYLHMTIHTAVLIETLKALSSDLLWYSCNIFSTQQHTLDVITHGESADVFSYKVEIIEDCWDCILNVLIQPEDNRKGRRSDLIVNDLGDMTLLIHEGKKAEELFTKDGTIPEPIYTYNVEFNIVQTIIKPQLEGGETDKWNKFVDTCMGVSVDTST